jgi:hypothetical protein
MVGLENALRCHSVGYACRESFLICCTELEAGVAYDQSNNWQVLKKDSFQNDIPNSAVFFVAVHFSLQNLI